jgi:nucleoside-diphosphate kinase
MSSQPDPNEKTLIVVKPGAVARGFVGEILGRFERRGMKLIQVKSQTMTKAKAEEFYSVHKERPFFGELVASFSGGMTVGAIVQGMDAVATVRRMVGATKSWEASPGTIRGDLAIGLTDNAIHASDSKESFERESKAYFS